MDIIGNIYKKHSKTLDKDFYLVVLGYVKRNVEYRLIKGVKEYEVTPYIFIDKQKVLSDYFDNNILNNAEDCNLSLFVCGIRSDNYDFLKEPLKDDDIKFLNYSSFVGYLKNYVTTLGKSNFNKWILKSKLFSELLAKNLYSFSKEYILNDIINKRLPLVITKNDRKPYINNYILKHFHIGLIKDIVIVIKKMDTYYEVWYVIDNKGYKLNTFESNELVDLLYYIENVKKSKSIEYLEETENYEYSPFDLMTLTKEIPQLVRKD